MNLIIYGCGIVLLSTLTTGQLRSAQECTTSEWFGCLLSPCYFASCPLFPDAICSVETKSCGGCRAVWTVTGQEVNCKRRPRCPLGVLEMTNCANNLCKDPFCPDFPRATCVPDICGHCEEDYYQDGIRVDCIGSFREQLRQLRSMMRGQAPTISNGPSISQTNPQRNTPSVQTVPTPLTNNEPVPIVLTNSPTNIDPVVQATVLPNLTGANRNVQQPGVIRNINEVNHLSLSSPGDMPPNTPIANILIETLPLIPSNSPVVGPLDTPAQTVTQRSNWSIPPPTPGTNSLNQGTGQTELNPAPSANVDPFAMFRVGPVNEPASGSPVTPKINPVPTESFNAFADFGIGGTNGQANAAPTAADLIPVPNPGPVEPFNPFAEFSLGSPIEAPTLNIPQNSEVPSSQILIPDVTPGPLQGLNAFTAFELTGPIQPIGNAQAIVPQNSKALITPQQNQLPPATNVQVPQNSKALITPQQNQLPPATNVQAPSPPEVTPPPQSQTPFQVSACVQGYVRRNCTENACAGQTCHIPGAKCFESNCGTCRAEWYLDGRLVDCSSGCPPNTMTAICTNPCSYMSCPNNPNAVCRSNKCGICAAEFFVNNKQVSCDIPSDSCPAGQKPQGCVCFSKICPMNSQARCRIVGCGKDCRIQYYKAGLNGIEEVPCGWYSRKRA